MLRIAIINRVEEEEEVANWKENQLLLTTVNKPQRKINKPGVLAVYKRKMETGL